MKDTNKEELEYRIGKLHLGPNDVLVIKCRERLLIEDKLEIIERFSDLFPGNKAIVLDPSMDLDVLVKDL